MDDRGRYIYGVAEGGSGINLGPIGMDGSTVYTVSCGSLCAIVHDCPAEPYQSADEGIARQWVTVHQAVLDEARERFGTVVPMSFDTILRTKDRAVSADQAVSDWLKEDARRLGSAIEKVRGRDEYAVRISCTPGMIAGSLPADNREPLRAGDRTLSTSPGTAYLHRQKADRAARAAAEILAEDWSREFRTRVERWCDDIMAERARKTDDGMVVLACLSCLVAREKVDRLGEELEKINNMEGVSVHFSGPWPPYSFVAECVPLAAKEAR